MRIVTKYELEEGDLELLKKKLLDHPCEECLDHERYNCDESEQYEECIKVYKERNLYELTLEIKKVHECDRKIKEIRKEQMSIVKSVNEQIGVPII